MKKAAFYTLGCKVNQYETEAMAELFAAAGYEIRPFEEPADVYVINTCTVTGMSDRKSRQIIRRAKKTNPHAIVAVTGCYAQTAPDRVAEIEGVNLVIGTNGRSSIVQLVEELREDTNVSRVCDIMRVHEFENMSVSDYSERTRAYIKIQEGCNQFCSYCIIPYARGPVRSRAEADILDEVSRLAEKGFREVIFTGIHVASYGLDTGTDLAELLNKANKIEKIQRIRLSSIEPMTLNREFIGRIRECDKLCPHFHLSLQSGCDETLKRMNRKYTVAQYSEIVDGIRESFPDAAVTTDIMVGFPGETEEEFEKTAAFVRKIGFADAHIFQYSPREGTPAARRSDQVPPEIKEERSKRIMAITQETKRQFLNSFVGKTVEVYFERRCENGLYEGKTANYITVFAAAEEELGGDIRSVVAEAVNADLSGVTARLLKK